MMVMRRLRVPGRDDPRRGITVQQRHRIAELAAQAGIEPPAGERVTDGMNGFTTHTVIRSLYDLRERTGRDVTADDVAVHLKTDVDVVLPLLRELKAARIFKDARRKGKRVWMPWGGWD